MAIGSGSGFGGNGPLSSGPRPPPSLPYAQAVWCYLPDLAANGLAIGFQDSQNNRYRYGRVLTTGVVQGVVTDTTTDTLDDGTWVDDGGTTPHLIVINTYGISGTNITKQEISHNAVITTGTTINKTGPSDATHTWTVLGGLLFGGGNTWRGWIAQCGTWSGITLSQPDQNHLYTDLWRFNSVQAGSLWEYFEFTGGATETDLINGHTISTSGWIFNSGKAPALIDAPSSFPPELMGNFAHAQMMPIMAM